MFTLVHGETRLSLVGCVLVQAHNTLRFYTGYATREFADAMVGNRFNQDELDGAQLFLECPLYSGVPIFADRLQYAVGTVILEYGNCLQNLWTEKTAREKGGRGPWPYVEQRALAVESAPFAGDKFGAWLAQLTDDRRIAELLTLSHTAPLALEGGNSDGS